MNEEQLRKLIRMSGIGKSVTFRNKLVPGERNKIGVVEDEVFIIVGDYKHLIQKILFNDNVSWDGSIYGYRTCYYTYDKDTKHIKWGQYTQFLTEKEYKNLLSIARDKGWDI